MRVRINYAVDWQELPTEVFRLIQRASHHAESIKSNVINTEIDIEKAGLRPAQIDTILDIRDELVKLDAYLADAAQMIIGHQQIKLQESAERGSMKPTDSGEQENTQEHGGEYGELLQRTGEISDALAEFSDEIDE